MENDFIKYEFIDECVERGGEVNKLREHNFISCRFDDYKKFIEFSRWMQKNILPKQSDIKYEYGAEYNFFDGEKGITASYRIDKWNSKLDFYLEKYESAEGLVYSLEEQVREEAPSIKSQEVIESIVSDAIDDWVDNFPIEKDDITIELLFDDIYDSWVILAKTRKSIDENDDIDKIFDKLEDKLKGELDKIPYPEPNIRK